MIKNTANQYITFGAIAVADGLPVTTGTPTVHLSKDGGSQATSTNTATHVGNGLWQLELTQSETNADHLGAAMVLANAVNAFTQVYPLTLSDFKSDATAANQTSISNAIAALNDFDPSTDTVALVTTVGSVTNPVETDAASRTASQANVSALSTSAEISALNDFDPSSDTVANVTTTGSVTNAVETDAASRNASKADVSSLATAASIAALNNFDPASDTVANVTTVGSVTNAVTTSNASDVTAIKGVTDKLDTALVLDGSVYQYTTNALENAPSGGGGGSAPTEADIYLYFTSSNRQDTFKADTSALATASSISALNDFDPASETVANVGTVANVTNAVSANVSSIGANAIDASAIAASAVTEIQTGLVTTGNQFTYTNQAGDTHNVTIS